MTFQIKYKDSNNIAEYAYDNMKYDIAVNRFYYSIYQMLLYEIEQKQIKIDSYKTNEENTHNKTINIYREKVLKKKISNKKGFKAVYEFNGKIQELKRLRYQADYEPTLLSEKEAKEAKQKFKELFQIIEM